MYSQLRRENPTIVYHCTNLVSMADGKNKAEICVWRSRDSLVDGSHMAEE